MPESLDYGSISARLSELRTRAGQPSFSEITKLVRRVRADRGVPPQMQTPARITVYDCFRKTRRRFDLDLVVDIARSLGLAEAEVSSFTAHCQAVQHRQDAAQLATVDTDPARPDHALVGRERDLELLIGHTAPVVIHGMAGVGKSSLVREAVARLREAHPDMSVVMIDLRGFAGDVPVSPHAAFDAVVRALGAPVHQLPSAKDQPAALAEVLHDRNTVLILDDAASTAQISNLIPSGSLTARIWITSRLALGPTLGAESIKLEPLSGAESVQLLRQRDPEATAGWTDDELAAVAQTVGGLPLGLGLVGSRISDRPDWSPHDVHRSLVDERGQSRLAGSVHRALDQTHQGISEQAARALRLWAVTPFRRCSVRQLAHLLRVNQSEADRLADELVASNLADRHQGRLALHDLVRTHGREQSQDHDRHSDRVASLAALLDGLVADTRGAAIPHLRSVRPPRTRILHPMPELDADAGLEFLETEIETLLLASDPECSAVRPTIAIELTALLAWFTDRTSRWQSSLVLFDRAAAAARCQADELGEGAAELERGKTLGRIGQLDAALLALQRAELLVAGDDLLSAGTQVALSAITFQLGDYAACERHQNMALELVERLGEPAFLARLHSNAAVLQERLGTFDKVDEHYAAAAAIAAEIGDHETEALVLSNSSGGLLIREQPAEALPIAAAAVEVCRTHGVGSFLGPSLCNWTAALTQVGRSNEALAEINATLSGSSSELETIGTASIIELLINRVDINVNSQQWRQAEQDLERALGLTDEIQSQFHRAQVLESMGVLALARGDRANATSLWQQALELTAGDYLTDRIQRRLEGALPSETSVGSPGGPTDGDC